MTWLIDERAPLDLHEDVLNGEEWMELVTRSDNQFWTQSYIHTNAAVNRCRDIPGKLDLTRQIWTFPFWEEDFDDLKKISA